MAHPYKDHAADKVARAKAKSYQTGGRVAEAESATETPSPALRQRGLDKFRQDWHVNYVSPGLRGGSQIDRMERDYTDRVVPRRKEKD